MHDIHISDPAWRTTFPYLVAPLPNEWLAGVLLRCDERNFWGSGTTLGYVLRPGSKQSAMNELSTIVPTVIALERLSHVLSVPVSRMLATTYLAELARLYGNEHLHAKLLSSSLTFHVCPACLAEERKLARWLTLPHIMHCPEHHLALVSSCSCGAALRLFHRKARPFTCPKCGRAWKNLPHLQGDPARMETEQHLLSSYQFFLTRGTPELLASTLRLIYDSVVEKGEIRTALPNADTQTVSEGRSYQVATSLGYLVHALWQLDVSPRDVVAYEGPLPWRSIKWLTFQCPEPTCPYVAMIRERTRLLDW
ncbi:MAG: TniQ family protein [Ktedonobacteraceae bacterium]